MRTLTLLTVALLLNGCGLAVSRLRLKRHFKKDFVCPSAKVLDWELGYRVEGCGMVAFYWCDGNGGSYSEHTGRLKDQIVGQAMLGMFALGFEGERCEYDHHYSSVLELAPDAGPEVRVVMEEVERSYFRAMSSFDGGRIELWAPRKRREYTLLKLYGEDPIIGDVAFTRDGAPVTVVAQQQVADTEVRFLIPTAQLHELEQTSFAIDAFGSSYALDGETLRALAKFEH